jgi:hypothetical protein
VSQLLVAQRALTVPGWAKDALWRRAQAIPSLDLRFAESKSLVDATTGSNLVTFTRASSGTFVGSDGVLQTAATDVPRFDHNPTTGESLGLLVEEQRTNLLLQSEDFSTTWTPTNTTVSTNQTLAPDGLTTADKILETATTAEHSIRQDAASQSAGTYTLSIFAKAAEQSVLQFVSTGVLGGQRANFNLANGVLGSVDAQITARIIPYSNGWYRCIATATTTTSGTLRAQWNIVTSATAARVESYAGDITKGLFLWGGAIEAGAFPTSYIPTTTAAVTRSADVATDTTRGAALRTLYAQFRSPASGTRPVVSLDDNTANERIEILTSGTDPKLLVTDGGSAVADIDAGAITANTTARLGARFNTDNFAASISGGAEVLDATGTMPTVDRIRVGSNQAGGYLNGTIARITGWESALPNLPTVTQ